jgi:hypothetical protein
MQYFTAHLVYFEMPKDIRVYFVNSMTWLLHFSNKLFIGPLR